MADHEENDSTAGAAAAGDDGEVPDESGYRVSQKVALDELVNKDADDDALNRWKASLLAGAATSAGDASDPRVVIIEEFGFISEGRDPIVFNFSTAEGVEAMKAAPIIIKEGCEYNLRVRFRVQHDTVLGLKFQTVVKRGGLKVDTSSHMIGSYAPTAAPVEFLFPTETAPSGMMARGKYKATSKFIDDDKTVHLEWQWSFEIKKQWGGAD